MLVPLCPYLRFRLIVVVVTAVCSAIVGFVSSSTTTSSNVVTSVVILRVRLPDGSLSRVQASSNDQTLRTVLNPLIQNQPQGEGIILLDDPSNNNYDNNQDDNQDEIQHAEERVCYVKDLDASQSIHNLGLVNGSIVTLLTKNQQQLRPNPKPSKPKQQRKQQQRWDPFPDLAKDYARTYTKYQRNQRGRHTNSFANLQTLQSELHVIEPQPLTEAAVQRLYLCPIEAERFLLHHQQQQQQSSLGYCWLFGRVTRERVHANRKKPPPSTSLSSTIPEDEYCFAAHVHAAWIMTLPLPTTSYSSASSSFPTPFHPPPPAVVHVAKWLGLQLVGWMFAYTDDDNNNSNENNDKDKDTASNTMPLSGQDVIRSAHMQLLKMELDIPETNQDVVADAKEISLTTRTVSPPPPRPAFVTLAMHTRTGTTEAFQVSDLCVQMAVEEVFQIVNDDDDDHDHGKSMIVTRHPVVVDGQESQQFDSLLCLINTALLSREGELSRFAWLAANHRNDKDNNNNNKKAKTTGLYVNKSGGISTKFRRTMATALRSEESTTDKNNKVVIMGLLSDFSVLVALYDLLGPQDCQSICCTVQQWLKQDHQSGRRRKSLDPAVKNRLRQLVEGGT